MKTKDKKIKIRIEFEFVPIEIDEKILGPIKDKFEVLLHQLMKDNYINMHHGASMTLVDVTPIEWIL